MTTLPDGHSDASTHRVTVELPGGRSPRLFTEPLREICALALLGANAVFLCLGVSGLLFVIDGWASDFGLRSARTFDVFVAGLIPVGLPVLAVLLATHVRPIVGRARLITLTALVEYCVSALFGSVTFLGAFAYDLSSVRATLEGVLARGTWAGLLVLAGVLVLRVWLGSFYLPRPQVYRHQPAYGRPYPGQPMHPNPGYSPGRPVATPPVVPPPVAPSPVVPSPVVPPPVAPMPASGRLPPAVLAPPAVLLPRSAAGDAVGVLADGVPTDARGWPAVPPPPMPAPPPEAEFVPNDRAPADEEPPTQQLG